MRNFGRGALSILASAGLASVAAAQPVQNVDTGLSFADIQAAIDDAMTLDGHTILVSSGTYVENVTVSKEINLYSIGGRSATTIEGISGMGALGTIEVETNVDNVDIGTTSQGFTVVGLDNGIPGVENAAIYFQGNHSNIRVVDNEIVANGDNGLLTEFGASNTDFEISGNTFSGQTFTGAMPAGDGFGQQFSLPNVPRQLVTIGCGSGCTDTSNIVFTNNMITGTAGGLNASGDEQGNTLATIDADGAVITGNTFAGTTTRFASSLRTRGPNTTISGNDFDSSGLGQIVGHAFIQAIGTSIADVVAANTFDAAAYVDGTTGTIRHSVAVAAAGAPDGSTVVVLPGTYTEQVLIDGKTDVTVQGAGIGSTLIHAPATLEVTFTTSGPNRPVVTVMNSTNVRIEDVTVDGLGVGNANNRIMGVAYYNASGALLDSEVLDVRDTPASGVQHGIGIYGFVDDLGPHALEIGACTVTGFQKNAMALSGDGLTVDVHDCSVTGAGYIDYTAQNGIQVGFGAGGTLTDNSVSDVFYDETGFTASAYLIYQSSGIDLLGVNESIDSQTGLYWLDTSGAIDGFTNVAGPVPTTSLDLYGVILYNTTAARLAAGAARHRVAAAPFVETSTGPGREARAPNAVTISNGCLTGNGMTGSVGVLAFSAGGPLAADVSGMSVSGWDYGLAASGAAVTFEATNNSISGNTTAGFDNASSGASQNAEYNWWGAADGPSGAGPGSGDVVNETGFPGSVDFEPFRIDGTSTTACAFTPAIDNDVVVVTPAGTQCPEACTTADVDIVRGDSQSMRGFSVTFQLDELALCSGLPSIVEGSYLASIGTTTFQRVDNGGGSYTIDCAILGTPCGQDAPSGTLFSLGVMSTSTSGAAGTITITDVTFRDCDNQPINDTIGAPGVISMDDTTPPAAIADLDASQKLAGNGGDGTTGIQLDFTAPGDAETIEVYRAGFGNYPEYDDAPGGGSVPPVPAYPPGAPWTLTSVSATGEIDEAPARDYWYFVAFAIDTCGYVSSASNMTGGTLNYHLGDVTDGILPGTGDNVVDGLDISALGGNYGISLGVDDPLGYLDVGPTQDGSVHTLPLTDNEIQFEDLILFSINFGEVSAAPGSGDIAGTARHAAPALALDVTAPAGGEVLATLSLRGEATHVKGAHAVIRYDASLLRLADVTAGDLSADPRVFLGEVRGRGTITVDAAVLGSGETFPGEGVIATLRFAAHGAGARPTLSETALRDASNREIGSTTTTDPGGPDLVPGRLALSARPNPFRSTATIVVDLPDATEGTLRVYDVNGRLVATLGSGAFPAGRHVATWDGRGTDGRRAAPGVYFYAFQGERATLTKKLLRYE